jgi:hypothetical protein
MTGSGPGREFYRFICGLLGAPLNWTALDRTREQQHIFRLTGPEHERVLVETRERVDPEGTCWIREYGFLLEYQPGRLWLGTCTTHRWDPRLAAKKSGDNSVIEEPPGRRHTLQAEKTEDIGPRRDRIDVQFILAGEAPPHLCGIPMDDLHRIRTSRLKTLKEVTAGMTPSEFNEWRRNLTDQEFEAFTPLEQELITLGTNDEDSVDDTWWT